MIRESKCHNFNVKSAIGKEYDESVTLYAMKYREVEDRTKLIRKKSGYLHKDSAYKNHVLEHEGRNSRKIDEAFYRNLKTTDPHKYKQLKQHGLLKHYEK